MQTGVKFVRECVSVCLCPVIASGLVIAVLSGEGNMAILFTIGESMGGGGAICFLTFSRVTLYA